MFVRHTDMLFFRFYFRGYESPFRSFVRGTARPTVATVGANPSTGKDKSHTSRPDAGAMGEGAETVRKACRSAFCSDRPFCTVFKVHTSVTNKRKPAIDDRIIHDEQTSNWSRRTGTVNDRSDRSSRSSIIIRIFSVSRLARLPQANYSVTTYKNYITGTGNGYKNIYV